MRSNTPQVGVITYPYDKLVLAAAEIRQVPGMGLGVFATRNIAACEIILTDSPIIVMQDGNNSEEFFDAYIDLPESIAQYLDIAAFSQARYDRYKRSLIRDARLWFRKRTKNNRTKIAGDFWTHWNDLIERMARSHAIYNNNTCGICTSRSGKDTTGFYPTFSRINHSCAPSANWSFNEDGTLRITANRTITTGEQIFISYDSLLTERTTNRRSRQAILANWGFECTCTRCEAER